MKMLTENIQKYPEYKDSGVEWLGEIPSHWEVKRLASFGTFSKGGGFSKANLTESGVSAILYGDIYTKYDIQIKNCVRFISNETAKKSIEIKKGNLLFTGSGETMEDIGKCVVFFSDEKTVAGGDVIIFEQNQNNSLFLSYVLNTEGAKFEKAKHSKGEIIVHTYGSKLKDIYIAIPPLPEQTAIAAFLDRKTALIDQAIDIKQKQIELLKERRQILIHKAVTRGLNPDVKMKDSGVEWIGEVPEGWLLLSFRRVSTLQQGLQIAIDKRLEEPIDGALEYITTKSIHNPNDLKHYVNKPKGNVVCEYDDVLLGRTGNTGEVVTNVKGVFHNNFFKIVYDRKKILKKFLVNYLSTEGIQKLIMLSAGVTTIPDLNHGDFLSLPFILPPVNEQEQIIEYIEIITNKYINAISLKEQEIEKLKEYKATLINSAVTGKIKVV